MKKILLAAGVSVVTATLAGNAFAEMPVWGVRAEQAEYRIGGDAGRLWAWDASAFVGKDALKFEWRSKSEYDTRADAFETLENQFLLRTPVSDFFDVVAGVRADTPKGPNRTYGVIGIAGLAPQWFEVNADLFVSRYSAARIEVSYEGLITNRLTLIPSVEWELPFNDDHATHVGAWGGRLEAGARLSYDVVDRLFSPYVGVHYERVFGATADLRRADGEATDGLFFVTGARVLF